MLAQILYNVELLHHSSSHRQYSGSVTRTKFVDGIQTINALMSNGTYQWHQKWPHTLSIHITLPIDEGLMFCPMYLQIL